MALLGEIIARYSASNQTSPNLGGLEHMRVSKGVTEIAQRAADRGVDPVPYLVDAAARAAKERRTKVGHFGNTTEPLDHLKEQVGQAEVTVYMADQSKKPSGVRKA